MYLLAIQQRASWFLVTKSQLLYVVPEEMDDASVQHTVQMAPLGKMCS